MAKTSGKSKQGQIFEKRQSKNFCKMRGWELHAGATAGMMLREECHGS
jgi:hypothetical protein